LWREPNSTDESIDVAIPNEIQIGTTEWRGVIDRIARSENRNSSQVEWQIRHYFIDVTRFKAANDSVIGESIPLVSGVGLLSTAYKILRASATTARRNRAQIGGNFSKLGDEITARARLGHTEQGSYIVPILMPLSFNENSDNGRLWEHEPGFLGRMDYETSERRVTRTMAEALTALSRIVVEPAVEPTNRVIDPLVDSGVSREFVLAIDQALSDGIVDNFETTFAWAPGFTAPAGIPGVIAISHESKYLLRTAARLLRTPRRDPVEKITGPIIEVRHVPDDVFGEFAIQAMRRGRQVEIKVRVDRARIDEVLEWMKTARTIIVDGQVVRDIGRPLRIDAARNVYPLDESFLSV
jgi:hypothetical protein